MAEERQCIYVFFPLRGSMPKGEEKRAGSNSVGQWQRENMFRATFSKFLENNRDIGLSSINTVTAGFLFPDMTWLYSYSGV